MNKKVLIINARLDKKDYSVKEKEIFSLLDSLNMTPVMVVNQNIDEINNKSYIGEGKLQEIKNLIDELDLDCVVTNFDVSPLQHKTICDVLKIDLVYDRTNIILEIFKQGAKSKEAKLQVEIALINYMKTRLVMKDANYEQVTSGGGLTNRGAGEKKINLTRGLYRRLLATKEKELDTLVKQRKVSRKKRNSSYIPLVAIVGYTNAGKSTLLNSLLDYSHSDGKKKVLQENRLFATLQTSTRLINTKDYPSFFLTDTVGFIDDLPTSLVKAFRSTLEEIKYADLLIQVVDVSSLNYLHEIDVTNKTLEELGASNIPMIYLFNKSDLLPKLPFVPNKIELFTSLTDLSDISSILRLIFDSLSQEWKYIEMNFPFEKDLYSFKKHAYVKEIKEKEDGYLIKAYLPKYLVNKYKN